MLTPVRSTAVGMVSLETELELSLTKVTMLSNTPEKICSCSLSTSPSWLLMIVL